MPLASTAGARSRCPFNSSIALALAVVTASETAVVVARDAASEMLRERPAMVAVPVEPGEDHAAAGPAAQSARCIIGSRLHSLEPPARAFSHDVAAEVTSPSHWARYSAS